MEITLTLTIVDFQPTYKEDFKRLNTEWMQSYFNHVLPYDQALIDNPEREIIEKGGHIFFAQADDQIVGTCALLRESHKVYEIALMAVTPQFRGQHLGKALLVKAVEKAKLLGAKQVYLVTSTKLTTSLEMYKAFGFREVPFDPETSIYDDGSDVKMSLNLK
jgi:N-acetylglutamate synthase-like GNAT family acetyltransferase